MELRAVIPPPRGGLTAPAGAVHRLNGAAMGTTWSVKLAGAGLPVGLQGGVQAELDAVVAAMSHWEPASELSRFNAAPAGAWVTLSPAFAAVMACALEVAELTDGAFDPAMLGAAAAWGFGPPGVAPGFTPGAWRRLRLEGDRLLQPGGVRLDLSGVAKGFAVDQVARLLERRGCGSFLVEVGGELYGRGLKPDGDPWWAAVEPPREGVVDAIRLALPGWAVATSGDYRRFLPTTGGRLAHTLDPRTGAPLEAAAASVTVLAADCILADAWATALTVMGEARGLAFADAHGLAALIFLADEAGVRAVASRAWEALWA